MVDNSCQTRDEARCVDDKDRGGERKAKDGAVKGNSHAQRFVDQD